MSRGFKKTIALIPGWAMDYRIFEPLDFNYNYLLPTKLYPCGFSESLLRVLGKNSLEKISLFGWSLGGFLAVDFALRNPDRIDELILVGIRKKFPQSQLDRIKAKLKTNRRAYLYKFYRQCFSDSDKEGWGWFRRHLLKDYLDEMALGGLLVNLDYLGGLKIDPAQLLSLKKIRVFHGSEDRIAPFKEVEEIQRRLSSAEFVCLPRKGHIPFLGREFSGFING